MLPVPPTSWTKLPCVSLEPERVGGLRRGVMQKYGGCTQNHKLGKFVSTHKGEGKKKKSKQVPDNFWLRNMLERFEFEGRFAMWSLLSQLTTCHLLYALASRPPPYPPTSLPIQTPTSLLSNFSLEGSSEFSLRVHFTLPEQGFYSFCVCAMGPASSPGSLNNIFRCIKESTEDLKGNRSFWNTVIKIFFKGVI